MKKNRFDLEQAIMTAWATCDDIDLIYHNTDNLHLSAEDCDNLQNQLLGLKAIADLRFNNLQSIFEEMASLNSFKENEIEEYLATRKDTDEAEFAYHQQNLTL